MRRLNKDALRDIANGACLLGSGGGGPREMALGLVEGVADSFSVEMVTVDEAAADEGTYTAVVGYGGPPSRSGGHLTPEAANVAFRELQNQVRARLGGEVGFVIPIEMGAVNSIVPCIVAANHGVQVVDGDGCGRAVPLLKMLTFAALGASPAPVVLSDRGGHTVILNFDEVESVDVLFKALVREPAFGGVAGFALWPMEGTTLRRVVPIRGTLSLALGAGEVLRTAKDPARAVTRWLSEQGRRSAVIHTGKVSAVESKAFGGLDAGRMVFEGQSGERELSVYFQNESFVAWHAQQDRPLALGPDSIGYLLADGTPFTNAVRAEAVVGREAAVLATSAVPEMLQIPSIREAFQELLRSVGYGGALGPMNGWGTRD